MDIKDTDNPIQPKNRQELFMTLYSIHQRKLFSYIYSATGRLDIAEEIMQQTLIVMWREFDKYKEGTHFTAWGKSIAYYRILNYRKQYAKEVLLDDAAFQEVVEMSDEVLASTEQRIRALEGCFKKLNTKSQALITLRYNKAMNCKTIAEHLNLPIQTVYKTLARVHMALKKCVQNTLVVWETD